MEIKNDYKDLDSDNYSSSNYKLIVEDNIKKIISTNVFPKVHFLFQTKFFYLVDMYKREYVQEKQARRECEKPFLGMFS